MDVRIGIGDSVHDGFAVNGDLAVRRDIQLQPFDGIQKDAGSGSSGSGHVNAQPESPTVSLTQSHGGSSDSAAL